MREKKMGSLKVLCKLWHENDVWNAVTTELPIAVFGNTIEEARLYLHDAIIAHLEAAIALGKIDDIQRSLKKKEAIQIIRLSEISNKQMYEYYHSDIGQQPTLDISIERNV